MRGDACRHAAGAVLQAGNGGAAHPAVLLLSILSSFLGSTLLFLKAHAEASCSAVDIIICHRRSHHDWSVYTIVDRFILKQPPLLATFVSR